MHIISPHKHCISKPVCGSVQSCGDSQKVLCYCSLIASLKIQRICTLTACFAGTAICDGHLLGGAEWMGVGGYEQTPLDLADVVLYSTIEKSHSPKKRITIT